MQAKTGEPAAPSNGEGQHCWSTRHYTANIQSSVLSTYSGDQQSRRWASSVHSLHHVIHKTTQPSLMDHHIERIITAHGSKRVQRWRSLEVAAKDDAGDGHWPMRGALYETQPLLAMLPIALPFEMHLQEIWTPPQ